jgi:hypothetical protein
MEDVLKIPGVFERMMDANILSPTTVRAAPKIPVQTVAAMVQIAPPIVPNASVSQAPEVIVPQISAVASRKVDNKVYWLVGGLILAIIFRYEIGYYVFGKPNKKYPR